jgi:hypothetical protein
MCFRLVYEHDAQGNAAPGFQVQRLVRAVKEGAPIRVRLLGNGDNIDDVVIDLPIVIVSLQGVAGQSALYREVNRWFPPEGTQADPIARAVNTRGQYRDLVLNAPVRSSAMQWFADLCEQD